MPLQNRVDPFGVLFADPARGLFMGNRGGRLHRGRALGGRRWASRQWICCRLVFKDRHRQVWGEGYTELFFLDEVTALAAGHRPCFECRRKEAEAFAECWRQVLQAKTRPRAPEMDRVLHGERIDGKAKRLHGLPLAGLPDGAMIARGNEAWAARGRWLLHWTPAGYDRRMPRPRGAANVLTPPAILAALAAGYVPHWHPSADG